jgi:hypothetical protein
LLSWIGFVLYQAYQIENVLSVVTDEYSSTKLLRRPNGEIFEGEKIVGEFLATDNYMGIIGFRFWTFCRLNNDFMIFRLKEKNQPNWFYEYSYKADQFQPNQYFTFGFPVIENSKGKEYVFEIESSQGRPGVAVGISSQNPVFIIKYKYPKSEIVSSPKSMINFGLIKLINLIHKSRFTSASYIYLLPLLIHLLFLKENFQKHLATNKERLSLVLIILGVILDTFFVQNSDVTILVILSMYIKFILSKKLSAEYFFKFGLYALLLCFSAYSLNEQTIYIRAGAWVWVFLTLSVLVNLYYIHKPEYEQIQPE